ncbi:MAG: hypothetical protein WD077_15675 [Bacteroidia bacterium]
MRPFILLTIALACCTHLHAQHLAAYVDYRDHFIAFNKGTKISLEHLPVQSYQVGGNSIGYLDNTGRLKVYYDGETTTLAEDFVRDFTVTDALLFYQFRQQFYVFDKGEKKLLTTDGRDPVATDSLITYFDRNIFSFRVYYNGRDHGLDDRADLAAVKNFEPGGNLVAFVDANSAFKVFYRGQIHTLSASSGPQEYFPGTDVVAWFDEYDLSFKVFYKGEITVLDNYRPRQVWAGNGLVAYLTDNEEFKVFDNGSIKDLSPLPPTWVEVTDRVLLFADLTTFRMYYNGHRLALENAVPAKIAADYRNVAYAGDDGRLRIIYRGERKDMGFAQFSEYHVYGDVVVYLTSQRKASFYYNGRTYQ